jgi:hypothetical protein
VLLEGHTHLWFDPEEIKALITNPDPQIPSHHQVDPRIIKAYLMGESVPTYLPGHFLPRYFGILPTYLPRDRFLPSELVSLLSLPNSMVLTSLLQIFVMLIWKLLPWKEIILLQVLNLVSWKDII